MRLPSMHFALLVAFGTLAFSAGFETSASAQLADSTKETGKQVFLATCQTCHKDTMNSIVPGQAILASMTPRSILAALDNGKMRPQAASLTEGQRKAVAEWLTNKAIRPAAFPQSAYTHFTISAGGQPISGYSGWGGNKASTGFRRSAQAGITVANLGSLKLKWAFAFPEATIVRSRPALAGDWLIVGGQFGDLFAINKFTGKIGWHFSASAAIRGAIVTVQSGNAITAYFADFSTNVYAVDVRTGRLIWNKRAGFEQQSAVTGSVAVHGGRVFVPITSLEVASAVNGKFDCCTSSGAVVALDATNGNEIWRHRVITQQATQSGKKKNGKSFYGPSGAPVWCSPTIDEKRGCLYIGTGENYSSPATTTSDAIQALDMRTGRLLWNFQATREDTYNAACPYFLNCPDPPGPDLDFGMAPILVKGIDGTDGKAGHDLLLAGQKSGVIYALSPATGQLVWKTRVGKGGALGGIHWGMATDGQRVYAANSDNLLALDRSDSSVHASPGLYALDVRTGKIIWKTASPSNATSPSGDASPSNATSPSGDASPSGSASPSAASGKNYLAANSAAPALVPGIVFAGALDGHIRAYATANGTVLWDFDTAKEFATSNGIKGKGGSIDGPAPVIADGMLFVNSGYGMFGQIDGNLLLAFSVDPPAKK